MSVFGRYFDTKEERVDDDDMRKATCREIMADSTSVESLRRRAGRSRVCLQAVESTASTRFSDVSMNEAEIDTLGQRQQGLWGRGEESGDIRILMTLDDGGRKKRTTNTMTSSSMMTISKKTSMKKTNNRNTMRMRTIRKNLKGLGFELRSSTPEV